MSIKENKTAVVADFFKRIGSLAVENVNFLFLILLVIVGAFASPKFFTQTNLLNILGRITISSFCAFGFTFVFLTGGFDLSIGSIVSVCAVLTVGLINGGTAWPLVILIVLVSGLAFGLLNGLMLALTRADLSATFLITLGTQLLGASIALTYTGGFQLYLDETIGKGFLDFMRFEAFGLPLIVLVMILFVVVFQLVLSRTQLGRKVYLVGGNKVGAFLAGIKVNKIKIFAFMMSAACAAIAALFITIRTTGASPKSGSGYEFDAAIATIIGGNVLGGGKGGMVKTFTGVLILAVMINIMNLVGIQSEIQRIIQGFILLVAIIMDSIKKRNVNIGLNQLKSKGEISQ